MRWAGLVAALALILSGCTAAHTPPPAGVPEAVTPTAAPPESPASAPVPVTPAAATPTPEVKDHLGSLSKIHVRELLADSQGVQFFVQDERMRLYVVRSSGVTALGEVPALGLVAAWGPKDGPFAFAREGADGKYEIVGVGHEGSKVLAKAVGYPGAMRFEGQTLHFIDAEGWKVVDWSARPQLKGKLDLGLRANRAADCAWLNNRPLCVGGYWDSSSAAEPWLTLVQPDKTPMQVAKNGEHPILAGASFTADGRMMAAVLGARSAGAKDHGRIVVTWMDGEGQPVKTKDYPILARQVAFDADGRLVVHQFPADGSGPGTLVLLDPEVGTTQSLTAPGGGADFAMAADGKSLYLIARGGGVTRITLPEPAT